MSTKRRPRRVRVTTYAFAKANGQECSTQTMCRVLDVAPSGYYQWLKQPLSDGAIEDGRLLRQWCKTGLNGALLPHRRSGPPLDSNHLTPK